MRFIEVLVIVSFVSIGFACASGVVHELGDENFEHDTQAATGATTGHWFVMFKSEGCHYCKQSRPAFESLAEGIEDHRTNIAIVDCDKSQWICPRFEVRSYPTFLLFARGRQYTYQGDRSPQSFSDFIKSGYLNEAHKPVAQEMSMWAKSTSWFVLSWDDLEVIKENIPVLYYGAVGATIVLLFLTAMLILLTIAQLFTGKAPAPPTKRPKVGDASKQAKKKQ